MDVPCTLSACTGFGLWNNSILRWCIGGRGALVALLPLDLSSQCSMYATQKMHMLPSRATCDIAWCAGLCTLRLPVLGCWWHCRRLWLSYFSGLCQPAANMSGVTLLNTT